MPAILMLRGAAHPGPRLFAVLAGSGQARAGVFAQVHCE
jgi:hypothetical protein